MVARHILRRRKTVRMLMMHAGSRRKGFVEALLLLCREHVSIHCKPLGKVECRENAQGKESIALEPPFQEKLRNQHYVVNEKYYQIGNGSNPPMEDMFPIEIMSTGIFNRLIHYRKQNDQQPHYQI